MGVFTVELGHALSGKRRGGNLAGDWLGLCCQPAAAVFCMGAAILSGLGCTPSSASSLFWPRQTSVVGKCDGNPGNVSYLYIN